MAQEKFYKHALEEEGIEGEALSDELLAAIITEDRKRVDVKMPIKRKGNKGGKEER